MKLKYIPQYILALVLALLVFMVWWTWHLMTPEVTFERLLIDPLPSSIESIKSEGYKADHSPILFKIKSSSSKSLLSQIAHVCKAEKSSTVPSYMEKTDAELAKIAKEASSLYVSSEYNLTNPSKGRFCTLFEYQDRLYVFVNGNL